jgi:hypothetical protein
MKTTKFYFTLAIFPLVFACNSSVDESTTTEQTDKVEAEQSLDLSSVKFVVKNEKLGEYDTPEAELWLKFSGKEEKISIVQGVPQKLEKSQWDDLFIPKEAIEAYHTHWGESTYYYIVVEDNSLNVYEGAPVQTGMDGRWQAYYDKKFSKKL